MASALLAFKRPTEEQRREQLRSVERFKTAVIRGAIIGGTLRGGLHFLGGALHVLTNLKAKKGTKTQRAVGFSDAVADTIRYIIFFGSLSGVYVAVDEALSILLGKARWVHHTHTASGSHLRPPSLCFPPLNSPPLRAFLAGRTSPWRALLAGAIAGQTLRLTGYASLFPTEISGCGVGS